MRMSKRKGETERGESKTRHEGRAKGRRISESETGR